MIFKQKNDFRPGQVELVLRRTGLDGSTKAMLRKALLDVGARQRSLRPIVEGREREIRERLDAHLGKAISSLRPQEKQAIKREADALVKRTDRIGDIVGWVWTGVSGCAYFGGMFLLEMAKVPTSQFFAALGAIGASSLAGVVLLKRIICSIERSAYLLQKELNKHLNSEPQREANVRYG